MEILTGRWPLLYGNEVRYDFGDDNNRLVSENIKVMSFRDSYGDADTTYYLQKRWNQHDIDEDTPMVNGQPLISLSSGCASTSCSARSSPTLVCSSWTIPS